MRATPVAAIGEGFADLRDAVACGHRISSVTRGGTTISPSCLRAEQPVRSMSRSACDRYDANEFGATDARRRCLPRFVAARVARSSGIDDRHRRHSVRRPASDLRIVRRISAAFDTTAAPARRRGKGRGRQCVPWVRRGGEVSSSAGDRTSGVTPRAGRNARSSMSARIGHAGGGRIHVRGPWYPSAGGTNRRTAGRSGVDAAGSMTTHRAACRPGRRSGDGGRPHPSECRSSRR